MQPLTNRRKYGRFEFPICKALVSKDKRNWIEANVIDVSAGGLKLRTQLDLDALEEVFVNMIILNKYSEFELKMTGKIARKDITAEQGIIYALEFTNIDKNIRIQIDELINSLSSTADHEHLDPEKVDGFSRGYGYKK